LKFGKFSTESENFSETGESETQGNASLPQRLRGMDAPDHHFWLPGRKYFCQGI